MSHRDQDHPHGRAGSWHVAPKRTQVRERLLHGGCGTVSDGDLLALLAGPQLQASSEARVPALMHAHDGLVGLAGLEASDLVRIGLPPVASARVAAAFELGRRLALARRQLRPCLKSPEEVVQALGVSVVGLRHEQLWCLPLDPASRLIGEPRIVSMGDVDGTDAGPRAFFRLALTAGATSAIACHNHPSGDPQPSSADYTVTRRLADAGRQLDLPLMDHVILGDGGRFSSIRRERAELFR